MKNAKSPVKRATKKKAAKKKVAQEVAADEPKRTEIYTLRTFPNPRWLLGEGVDGTAAKVEVPVRMRDRLLHKTIPVVELVDEGGEKYYKYAP